MARMLTEDDVEAGLIRGLFLSAGGSGRNQVAKHRSLAQMALDYGGVRLVSLGGIADDAFVVTAAGIGAPGIANWQTQLGLPFERVTLDLAKGEAARPAFRAKSRFARVPVLELKDGRTIVESAAIMLYLAEGTRFLPDDNYLRAEGTSWLTFEQADLLRALSLPRFYHGRRRSNGLAHRELSGGRVCRASQARRTADRSLPSWWMSATRSPTSARSATSRWRRRADTT
jgi:hypothetical protein